MGLLPLPEDERDYQVKDIIVGGSIIAPKKLLKTKWMGR